MSHTPQSAGFRGRRATGEQWVSQRLNRASPSRPPHPRRSSWEVSQSADDTARSPALRSPGEPVAYRPPPAAATGPGLRLSGPRPPLARARPQPNRGPPHKGRSPPPLLPGRARSFPTAPSAHTAAAKPPQRSDRRATVSAGPAPRARLRLRPRVDSAPAPPLTTPPSPRPCVPSLSLRCPVPFGRLGAAAVVWSPGGERGDSRRLVLPFSLLSWSSRLEGRPRL